MSRNPVLTRTPRPPHALYEACVQNDDDAIAEFVRLYQPELAGYARRHHAEDPDGAANLATFDTLRRLAHMRRLEEPAVRAYLYRALKGRLIDERRASLARVPLDETSVELVQDGPEQPVLSRIGLNELLDVLTPAEREVVSHRFVAGYTSVETAARVGRSPDAVRRLQSNALARLRLVLAIAAAVVAIGAGYWVLAGSSTVETSDPIDNPTDSEPAPQPAPEDLTPSEGQQSTGSGVSARATGQAGGAVASEGPTPRAGGSSTTSPANPLTSIPSSDDQPAGNSPTTPIIASPQATSGPTPTHRTTAAPTTTNPPTTGPPTTNEPTTTKPSTTAKPTTTKASTPSTTGPDPDDNGGGNPGNNNGGGNDGDGNNGQPNGRQPDGNNGGPQNPSGRGGKGNSGGGSGRQF